MWWSWKNWFWTVSTFRQCNGLEKNWFWTVSSLIGCGGHERTDFEQFLLCEGVVVMKELILNSFYFGKVWWSWKNWFWTVSTLGGCGGLEKNWFWTVSTLGWCGGVEGTYGRCTGKHWGHTRGCLNILGVGGIRMVSKCMGHPNIWGCADAPKHMGVSSQHPPSVKVTCH